MFLPAVPRFSGHKHFFDAYFAEQTLRNEMFAHAQSTLLNGVLALVRQVITFDL